MCGFSSMPLLGAMEMGAGKAGPKKVRKGIFSALCPAPLGLTPGLFPGGVLGIHQGVSGLCPGGWVGSCPSANLLQWLLLLLQWGRFAFHKTWGLHPFVTAFLPRKRAMRFNLEYAHYKRRRDSAAMKCSPSPLSVARRGENRAPTRATAAAPAPMHTCSGPLFLPPAKSVGEVRPVTCRLGPCLAWLLKEASSRPLDCLAPLPCVQHRKGVVRSWPL